MKNHIIKERVLAFLFFSLTFFVAEAQISNPVKWEHNVEYLEEGNIKLNFKASIEENWHLYSIYTPEGGPLPTTLYFLDSSHLVFVGTPLETPKPITTFDEIFETEVSYFSNEATISQIVKAKTLDPFTVKVEIEFSVCDDEKCLPPEIVAFEFDIEPQEITKISSVENPSKESRETLWTIFIAGFLGGLIALLTPCVFPMVPLTISYFSKQSNKFYPIIYGLSIIFLYVFLGFIITVLFGADALNSLASNGFVNMLFFLVFIVFALSFLGLFEITLPSKWINKSDAKAEKGGLVGVFFMAFTLALVSFSCTGPIIGTLLVEASIYGATNGPLIGMFGFSLALALPFTVLSFIPKLLNNLPKSGGWLQTVKVTLGFLEIALALKFLSNVDLAYNWQLLDREVFLVIWVAIFALLTLYLAGFLQMEHDSPNSGIGPFRLFITIICLSFTLYLIPGLWGAPLKSVSAFLPPESTQDFNLNELKYKLKSPASNNKKLQDTKKNSEGLDCPHGLDCYFDMDEAIAQSKTQNKPIFIDFTGKTCVNCRKMEAYVWSDEEVHKRLQNDFIVVSLYVDYKVNLPASDYYTSETTGKKIRTIGQKWSDYQISRFKSNSQPYYIIMDSEDNILSGPVAYDTDIQKYINFLDKGKAAYKK